MKCLLSTALFIILAASMSACTVTFDGMAGADDPTPLTSLTITEQGNTFIFTSEHFHAMAQPECLFGGCVANSTVYIAEEAGSLGRPITMTREGGAPFTLTSFAGAQMFVDDAAAAAGGFPNATT